MLKRRGENSAHVFSWFTYIVSLEVINRLSVRGRKSRLYAEVMLQKKKKNNTHSVSTTKSDVHSTPVRRREDEAEQVLGGGVFFKTAEREGGRYIESARAPVSALFLPSCFSLSLSLSPSEINSGEPPSTLHTELQQSRGVASSTKVRKTRCVLLNNLNAPI